MVVYVDTLTLEEMALKITHYFYILNNLFFFIIIHIPVYTK